MDFTRCRLPHVVDDLWDYMEKKGFEWKDFRNELEYKDDEARKILNEIEHRQSNLSISRQANIVWHIFESFENELGEISKLPEMQGSKKMDKILIGYFLVNELLFSLQFS